MIEHVQIAALAPIPTYQIKLFVLYVLPIRFKMLLPKAIVKIVPSVNLPNLLDCNYKATMTAYPIAFIHRKLLRCILIIALRKAASTRPFTENILVSQRLPSN